MLNKKPCLFCGKVFEFVRKDARVCSNSCRCKLYFQEHLSWSRERSRKRYAIDKVENYEHIREVNRKATRKYKEINRESIRVKDREYNKRTGQPMKYHNSKYFGGNKENALNRDNHQCTLCGKTDGLVVHHIDKSGSRHKKDKISNNSLDNLQTLCHACHINIHREDLNLAKLKLATLDIAS